MNRHHPHHSPDFFAVLLILVVIGFGMTLAIQVGANSTDQVVNSDRIESVQDAG
jgi:hypothetical protein